MKFNFKEIKQKKRLCVVDSIGGCYLNIDEFIKNKPFLRHEIQHVIQFQTIRFFRLKYIFQTIIKGYKNNKYELEAERNKYSDIPVDYVIIYQ